MYSHKNDVNSFSSGKCLKMQIGFLDIHCDVDRGGGLEVLNSVGVCESEGCSGDWRLPREGQHCLSKNSLAILGWLQVAKGSQAGYWKSLYFVARCRFAGLVSLLARSIRWRDVAPGSSKINIWIPPTNPRATSIRANDGSFTIRQIPWHGICGIGV